MAILSHTQCWFVCPKSDSDHQGVIWIQSFPSFTPANDWQALALSGCYARQFGPQLLIGYLQLTYCTFILMYIFTYIYTHP